MCASIFIFIFAMMQFLSRQNERNVYWTRKNKIKNEIKGQEGRKKGG